MKRTFVFGDLHGMASEFETLIDQCKITPDDRIICVGDMIDRGPENARCVDLVMEIEKRQGSLACVLGNHEDTHIRYDDIQRQGKDPNVQVPTHVATRKQLKPIHYDYFRSLPLFIRLPEFNAAIVHAGVFPGLPLEEQSRKHLLHAQMINPVPSVLENGQVGPVDRSTKWPSKAPPAWRFWTHYWTGPETIIFGHSVLNKPLVLPNAIGIDGGAVFGRKLWALELPSMQIHELESKHDHGGGVRGRPSEEDIALGRGQIRVFPIHNDVGTFS
jgi:serine/threonine protein phosphatase 1